jgi:molybdate-binding protein/DNA-binding transcriptional regulator YhcF (GntR family)
VSGTPLFQEIAESIRGEILRGRRSPGEELPPVRTMAKDWGCAPGTVQRAYNELALQGLVVSHRGQGTRVTSIDVIEGDNPLRRATLINQVESFLLRSIQAGYSPTEIDAALHLALDRWRTLSQQPPRESRGQLDFVGSHDPTISLLNEQLSERDPKYGMRLSFAGSLGGLIAMARGEADIAGCHLWDQETDSYNKPFVRRLLPGRKIALVRLANRRLGLIVATDNPLGIHGFEDFHHIPVKYANRQAGSGTRVLADVQIHNAELDPGEIQGYKDELHTHTEVARAVADGQADVGLAIESAARVYGLDFIPLTLESYDLVIPVEAWENEVVQAVLGILSTGAFQSKIEAQGGYNANQTGAVTWVE